LGREVSFQIIKVKKSVELWQSEGDLRSRMHAASISTSKIPTAKLIFEPGEDHISFSSNKRKDSERIGVPQGVMRHLNILEALDDKLDRKPELGCKIRK